MNHIGLFEGIGGFALAAKWMEWETIAWCEKNPFCQKVLKYYFPNAIAHGDIKTTDFSIYRGQCDIVTAGFPCQPWSQAGKRKGKADDRNLWPENIRAVREIQPGWFVGENVPGLINWEGGMVLNEITADLENEGFEVASLIIPACGKDAPHKRDRLWIVAYSSSNGQQPGRFGENRSAKGKSESQKNQRQRVWNNDRRAGEPGNAADTEQQGLQKPEAGQQFNKIYDAERNNSHYAADTNNKGLEKQQCKPGNYEQEFPASERNYNQWSDWPTQPPLCSRNDGLSSRLSGITFSKHRIESIMAYGNSVVPQIVLEIFKAIEQTKKYHD